MTQVDGCEREQLGCYSCGNEAEMHVDLGLHRAAVCPDCYESLHAGDVTARSDRARASTRRTAPAAGGSVKPLLPEQVATLAAHTGDVERFLDEQPHLAVARLDLDAKAIEVVAYAHGYLVGAADMAGQTVLEMLDNEGVSIAAITRERNVRRVTGGTP